MKQDINEAYTCVNYALIYYDDPNFLSANKTNLRKALEHLKKCQNTMSVSITTTGLLKQIRDTLDHVELHGNLGLAEAAVIALDQLRDTIIKENPGYRWSEIDDFIRQGQKIMAIKVYRDIHGSGLYDSKLAVEKRAEYLRKTI